MSNTTLKNVISTSNVTHSDWLPKKAFQLDWRITLPVIYPFLREFIDFHSVNRAVNTRGFFIVYIRGGVIEVDWGCIHVPYNQVIMAAIVRGDSEHKNNWLFPPFVKFLEIFDYSEIKVKSNKKKIIVWLVSFMFE